MKVLIEALLCIYGELNSAIEETYILRCPENPIPTRNFEGLSCLKEQYFLHLLTVVCTLAIGFNPVAGDYIRNF